jgi:hypothetical protein
MNRLNKSIVMRIAAAAMLLALRACLVVIAVSINKCFSHQASLHQAECQETVLHVSGKRRISAIVMVSASGLHSPVKIQLPFAPSTFITTPAESYYRLNRLLPAIFGLRGPPL